MPPAWPLDDDDPADAPATSALHSPKNRHSRHRYHGPARRPRPVMAEAVTPAPPPASPLLQGRAGRRLQKLTRHHAPTSHAADGLGRMLVVLGVLLGLTILALVLTLAFPGTLAGTIGLVMLIALFAVVMVPLLVALLRH